MDDNIDLAYWLELFVKKVFKDHPAWTIAILASFSGIVVTVMLLRAKNPDELVFPLFGLIFVIFVLAGPVLRVIRKSNVQDTSEDDRD